MLAVRNRAYPQAPMTTTRSRRPRTPPSPDASDVSVEAATSDPSTSAPNSSATSGSTTRAPRAAKTSGDGGRKRPASRKKDPDGGDGALHALLTAAVEETARLLHADGAMVYLMDPGSGNLRFA